MKYHVQNYSMCIERMRDSYVGLGEIALKATGNAWDSGGLWEGNSGLGGKYLWRRGDSYETDLLGGEGLWEESFENELVAQGSMRYGGGMKQRL